MRERHVVAKQRPFRPDGVSLLIYAITSCAGGLSPAQEARTGVRSRETTLSLAGLLRWRRLWATSPEAAILSAASEQERPWPSLLPPKK